VILALLSHILSHEVFSDHYRFAEFGTYFGTRDPEVWSSRLAFHPDPGRPSRLDGEMTSCTHLDHVRVTQLPESVEGCEECLATGGQWLHLRICLECGRVGCCDDSPNRHATAHARGSGHPLIRSLEPGEEWSWCFVDDFALLVPGVQGETRIPPSPLG
jgi:hypothetical protein